MGGYQKIWGSMFDKVMWLSTNCCGIDVLELDQKVII